jgi:flagellar basal body P-ring formation protein FlgA
MLLMGMARARAETSFDAQIAQFLQQQASGVAPRIVVSAERLDAKGKLAPCQSIEPYLPAGTRLPGRVTLGVRCTAGANWNVFLPAKVTGLSQALVAARPLPAGSTLADGDYVAQEIDVSANPGGVFAAAADFENMILLRAVRQGEALRPELFRGKLAITQGELVRVTFLGAGFSISAEGKALSQASLGQRLKVQADGGRILSGIARAGKTVEVQF